MRSHYVPIGFMLLSIGVMGAGLIINRLDPGIHTALSIPLFNVIALFIAGISLLIAIVQNVTHKSPRSFIILLMALCSLAGLAVLFPLANSGSLSVMQ